MNAPKVATKNLIFFLFAVDKLFYVENPKDSTPKLLKTYKAIQQVPGYKTNLQKSVAYLYINHEPEKKRNQGIESIYNFMKKHMIPRIDPDQRGKKNLYSENY